MSTADARNATLRLAAMTDQTEDFREYITQTQKMRAYRGKIEGPLAAKIAAQSMVPPPPKPVEERPDPDPKGLVVVHDEDLACRCHLLLLCPPAARPPARGTTS